MKLWKKIVLVLVLLLVGVVGYVAYTVHRTVTKHIPNSYAVEWVAGMVIGHMEANDGVWPDGWDALRDDYAAAVEGSGKPWTFDELRTRVAVDWDADPERLLATASEDNDIPFKVIWLTDGSSAHWAGWEPNRMILDFLQEHRSSESEEQTGLPDSQKSRCAVTS